MPKLSVIIPTYKRPAILAECLNRLERQTIAANIEIIVVSDGHDDETVATVKSHPSVKFLEIPKSQQGVARNKGVSVATGEIVLFIGDDIFLEPDACEKHLQSHKSQVTSAPIAVLGFTTWDPAVGITPVMTWLESSGWQFGYPQISAYSGTMVPTSIQYKFTYTSHISVPLSVAKKHPFRTDVHLYGWEDIEWGMRLKSSGVRLYYEPAAKAWHHHHITFEQSLARMETLGRSVKEFESKAQGFDRTPKGLKLLAYKILAIFPTMSGKHRKAFLRGLSLT